MLSCYFNNNSRLLVLCLTWPVISLTACGGGSDSVTELPEPIICDSTSYLDDGLCVTFAIRADERIDTPFTENGLSVSLEVVLFKPLSGDRFPSVIFHHGSTGDGTDPSQFVQTFTSKTIARFFVERGWMVAFPQRRGRGASEGLYDEGFRPDRSAYSCQLDITLAGAERALTDIDVISNWAQVHPAVDATRLLIGGTSRGGILSLAHVGRRPDTYLSAINFVGGWLGEGCGDHLAANRDLFMEGSQFPGRSLWLYGENDSFYSLAYSRANYDAFTAAGGDGDFFTYMRAQGLNGHFIINDPGLWQTEMDEFLAQL